MVRKQVEAVAMALKFPNVYLGSATWPPRRWAPAFAAFVSGPGRTKTIYGSGFPVTSHADGIAQLRALELGEQTESLVLGATARRIFQRLA